MSSQQYESNNVEDGSVSDKYSVKVKSKTLFPGFGILCAILSAVLYSCGAAFVKMVDLHPIQLGLSRCVVQFLILLPLLQFKHKTVDILGPPGFRVLLWWQGFLGSASMVFLYLAINELSVGNAVTLYYLNMVMVPFFARIFIKESISIINVVFVLVSLAGVVLISKPTFLFPDQDIDQQSSVLGVVYSILSATGIAFIFITLRKLGPVIYPPLAVFSYSFCGSLITAITLIILDEFRFPCWNELPFVFLLGVLGILGQVLLNLALHTEQAGVVSILHSTQIIFIYILQVLFFGDIPSVLSLVGASLIFSCSIGIGAQKLFNERKRKEG